MPRRSPFTSVIAGAFHGHVGARAHGDAHVGRGQRRRVVDAVARHRHHAPLRLQALRQFRALSLRQHFRRNFVDAKFAARPPRPLLAVVAGQHHDRGCLVAAAPASPPRSWSLIGSATPSSPAGRPSTATNTTVCASRRRRSARRSERPRVDSTARRGTRALPTDDACAVDAARARPAGHRLESPRLRRQREPRARCARRRSRRPADARSLAPAPAARRSSSRSSQALGRPDRRVTRGLPSSACRSCRPRACRPSRAARAPRRS